MLLRAFFSKIILGGKGQRSTVSMPVGDGSRRMIWHFLFCAKSISNEISCPAPADIINELFFIEEKSMFHVIPDPIGTVFFGFFKSQYKQL